MAKSSDPKKPVPNPTGDFIISDTRLGIGTTSNLSTLTVRARDVFNLTGLLTSTTNSNTVTGVGTLFLSELCVGDLITVGGNWDATKGVVAIASDTSLTVDSAFFSGVAGVTVQVTPSAARFDDCSGGAQVSVNGQGNVGVGTTGARAQLEVFGGGAGSYFGCPTGVRIHNTQSSDAWQLVLSADAGATQPGALFWVSADGDNQASMTISTFDGDESHSAVDLVRIDSAGFHLMTALSVQVSDVNSDYTVDPGAHYILADAGTAGITITLPDPALCGGRTITIIKYQGTGAVTVATTGADTINGVASKQITTMWEGLQLVSPFIGGSYWIAHVLTAA